MKYTRTSKASDLNRKMDIWNILQEKEELGECKKCGKKIYIYWRKKKAWETNYKKMDLCSPCYNKR